MIFAFNDFGLNVTNRKIASQLLEPLNQKNGHKYAIFYNKILGPHKKILNFIFQINLYNNFFINVKWQLYSKMLPN